MERVMSFLREWLGLVVGLNTDNYRPPQRVFQGIPKIVDLRSSIGMIRVKRLDSPHWMTQGFRLVAESSEHDSGESSTWLGAQAAGDWVALVHNLPLRGLAGFIG